MKQADKPETVTLGAKDYLKPPYRNPRYPPDAHVDALFEIAKAIREQAEATVLLARATAGEFDEQDGEYPVLNSLSDVR